MKPKELKNRFFSAVNDGYPLAVSYYLSKGAKINDLNHSGETALMSAAREGWGHYDTFCLLLKSGADVSIKNRDDETVLDILNNRLLSEKNTVQRAYILAMIQHIEAGDLALLPAPRWNYSSQSKRDMDLLSAVINGDLKKVIKKVKKGANLYFFREDYSEYRQMTAVEIAAQLKNQEIVSVLLTQLAYNGLLFEAIGQNDVAGVRNALEQGANPFAYDKSGMPVVIYAVQKGNLDILKVLRENGADFNQWGLNQTTPLLEAAKIKRSDMVEFMLQNGADQRHMDFQGNTALIYAVEKGDFLATKLLLEGKYLDKREEAFLIAIDKGYNDIVTLMVKDGIDLTRLDTPEMPLLLRAVRSRNTKVFEAILKQIPDQVNTPSLNDEYPVIEAAKLGYVEMLSMMRSCGADLHVKKQNGCTALHEAILKKHVLTAQFLIHNGLDVNATAFSTNETPLRLAAQNGSEEIVATLLNNGAKDISEALSLAVKRRQYKIVDILTEENLKIEDCVLIYSVLNRDIKMLNLLLDKNANVNVADEWGNTPLSVAIVNNDPIMVYTLLKAGANPLQQVPSNYWSGETGNALDCIYDNLKNQRVYDFADYQKMRQIFEMLQKSIKGIPLTNEDRPICAVRKVTTNNVLPVNQNVLTRM